MSENLPKDTKQKRIETKWIISGIVIPLILALIGCFTTLESNKNTDQLTSPTDIGVLTPVVQYDVLKGRRHYDELKEKIHKIELEILKERNKVESERQKRLLLENELAGAKAKLDALQNKYQGIDLSTNDVHLTWDSSNDPGIMGYMISYGISPGDYTSLIDAGNRTRYTITGLNCGSYYFAVTAYDENGKESNLSDEVHIAISRP
jgi:hypothetical protein